MPYTPHIPGTLFPPRDFSNDINVVIASSGRWGFLDDSYFINDKYYERGEGIAIKCQKTGVWGPSSRMKQMSDGRFILDYVDVRSPLDGVENPEPRIDN